MELLETDELIETIEHYVRDHNCNHSDFDPEGCSVCRAKIQLAVYEMGYEPDEYDYATEVMELEGEAFQDVVDNIKQEVNRAEKKEAWKWFLKGINKMLKADHIVDWNGMREDFDEEWENDERGEFKQSEESGPILIHEGNVDRLTKGKAWDWFSAGFKVSDRFANGENYEDWDHELREEFERKWDSNDHISEHDEHDYMGPDIESYQKKVVNTKTEFTVNELLAKQQAKRFYLLGFLESDHGFNRKFFEEIEGRTINLPEGLPDEAVKKLGRAFAYSWMHEKPHIDHSTEPQGEITDEEKDDNYTKWIDFWNQVDKKFSGMELREIYPEGSHTVRFIFDNGCNISLSVDDVTKKHPEITNLDFRHNEKEES